MKREFYLQSSLPQESVLRRLMMNTTLQRSFYYPELVDRNTNSVIKYKTYYGVFRGNSFTLAQSYPVRTIPNYVIYGEVLPKEGGCTLHYRVGSYWFAILMYAVILVSFPIMFFFLLSETQQGDLDKIFMYLLMIAYVIEASAFFLYEYHCAKNTIESVYEDFSRMLK